MEVGAAARGVALVEDEVDHPQHPGEPLRPGRGVGQGERLTGLGHGALGAADALRHRRLGDEEGGGDLPGAQPAQGAQREGDG